MYPFSLDSDGPALVWKNSSSVNINTRLAQKLDFLLDLISFLLWQMNSINFYNIPWHLLDLEILGLVFTIRFDWKHPSKMWQNIAEKDLIKMTSYTISIVAFSGGLKCPRKIHWQNITWVCNNFQFIFPLKIVEQFYSIIVQGRRKVWKSGGGGHAVTQCSITPQKIQIELMSYCNWVKL